jgi:hypothetical protein
MASSRPLACILLALLACGDSTGDVSTTSDTTLDGATTGAPTTGDATEPTTGEPLGPCREFQVLTNATIHAQCVCVEGPDSECPLAKDGPYNECVCAWVDAHPEEQPYVSCRLEAQELYHQCYLAAECASEPAKACGVADAMRISDCGEISQAHLDTLMTCME